MPKNYILFLRGGVGYSNFDSEFVNWVLDKNKDKEVNVLVNSLGGYTHEGVAISSLFKLHGNVHVHFVGHNASAATIAAMGAKHVSIDEDAAFLVHKCLIPVVEWDYMNADELDEHIKKLEKLKQDQNTIDSCIAGMYARRCKKSKDELLKLMSAGGWLTPEQALEWGFVDEITHCADDEKPELSEATINSLSSAGIPLPPNIRKTKGTVLERFIAFLQSPFSNPTPDNISEGADSQSVKMDKLASLSSLLGSSPAIADNKISISLQQAEKIESTLNDNRQSIDSLNSKIEELKASVAQKDKAIAEMKNDPASSTDNVVDTNKDSDPYAPVSEADALAASRAFLESSL